MVPEDDGPAALAGDERGSGLDRERGGRGAGGWHGLGCAAVQSGAARLELGVERRWAEEPATAGRDAEGERAIRTEAHGVARRPVLPRKPACLAGGVDSDAGKVEGHRDAGIDGE